MILTKCQYLLRSYLLAPFDEIYNLHQNSSNTKSKASVMVNKPLLLKEEMKQVIYLSNFLRNTNLAPKTTIY